MSLCVSSCWSRAVRRLLQSCCPFCVCRSLVNAVCHWLGVFTEHRVDRVGASLTTGAPSGMLCQSDVTCDMTHSMCLSNQHIFLTCHNVERSSVQISFQCFLQTCKACVFLVSGKTLNTMQYHLHFGSYGHASCLWPDPESVHLFYVTSG